MDYVLRRRKKKTIITVFMEGGKRRFFSYSVYRDGTEAMRIEEEHRTGRLFTFLF